MAMAGKQILCLLEEKVGRYCGGIGKAEAVFQIFIPYVHTPAQLTMQMRI